VYGRSILVTICLLGFSFFFSLFSSFTFSVYDLNYLYPMRSHSRHLATTCFSTAH
jgi:hypothetical protein